MKPVIQVENLSKQYQIGHAQQRHDTLRDALVDGVQNMFQAGKKRNAEADTIWALKEVSFEVQAGEVLGVIGRNGAGKSTLLKILSRISEPTSGRAVISGRVGSLLEVGTGFHPELTGRENIFLNGAILGMRRAEIERKFDEIVAFSEIEKFLDTPVKRYSSGMYVRLAFAVAAHLDPEVLLVDEVLAVGDAAFQKKCLGKMGDISSEGRTILFVSHNMVALKKLCKTAILIEGGHCEEIGDSASVVDHYLKKSIQIADEKEISWQDFENAPGDNQLRLIRLFIQSSKDTDGTFIDIDHGFEIGTEFELLEPAFDLRVNFRIQTSDEITILWASTNDQPELRERKFPEGHYRLLCRFPGKLLNEGRYLVSVVISSQQKELVRLENRLSFEIVDTGSSRHNYFGIRAGIIVPVMPWDLERIPALEK